MAFFNTPATWCSRGDPARETTTLNECKQFAFRTLYETRTRQSIHFEWSQASVVVA